MSFYLDKIKSKLYDLLLTYYNAIRMIELRKEGLCFIAEEEGVNSLEELEKVRRYVEVVLSMMHKSSRDFILNEFNHRDDQYWWMEFYTHSTYYRVQRRALLEFDTIIKLNTKHHSQY